MGKKLLKEQELLLKKEANILENFSKVFNKIKREEDETLDEDWKKNLAAGLMSLGATAAAGQNIGDKHNIKKQDINNVKIDTPKKDISDIIGNTLPIVDIQYGVTDGKTGKSAVYVYHKKVTDPTFDPKRDRELVYVDNLDMLRRTYQYQDYMRHKHNLKNGVQENEELNNEMDIYSILTEKSYLERILPVLKSYNVERLIALAKELMVELGSDYTTIVLSLEKIGNKMLN